MTTTAPQLGTEQQRADARRLHAKVGRRTLAKRLGLSEWDTRLLLASLGLRGVSKGTWKDDRPDLCPECKMREQGQKSTGCPVTHVGPYTAEDYLRDHAGEMSKKRLAKLTSYSVNAVRMKLSELNLRPSDLRTDLTVSQVAKLIGYSEDWVRGTVKRKEMPWRETDGVLRVWPSELRAWVLEDPRSRVQWSKVAREDLGDIAGLIAGDWGVSDTERQTQRRKRRAEEAKAA